MEHIVRLPLGFAESFGSGKAQEDSQRGQRGDRDLSGISFPIKQEP